MKQNKHIFSETGHTNIALEATLLAAISLILLTIGAAQANVALAWIGGIGAAVLLLAQFFFVHQEFGRLWQHIDELEKK